MQRENVSIVIPPPRPPPRGHYRSRALIDGRLWPGAEAGEKAAEEKMGPPKEFLPSAKDVFSPIGNCIFLFFERNAFLPPD